MSWKGFGKGLWKVAKVAAPIALAATGVGIPAAVALSAGMNVAEKKAQGASWKDAGIAGGIGAGTALIPGGGAVGGNLAGVGLKSLATGVAKGAAQNFATGAGTSLATGHGVKDSLKAGGSAAVNNLGTTGGAGGFKQAATNVAKQTALNAGSQYATRGLQAAGVPGVVAAQGGNVFSNYLGNKFSGGGTPTTGGTAGRGTTSLQPSNVFLPQGAGGGTSQGGIGGGAGFDWKGALSGAAQGALNNYATQQTAPAGGGQSQPTFPGGSPSGGSGSGRLPPYSVGDQTSGTYTPAGGSMTFPPQDTGSKAPTWQERYGPLIAQGAGVLGGIYAGKAATKSAQQRSPEEMAALGGAQGAAGTMGQLGGQLARQGLNYMQDPGAYFQTLLGGNRAAMSQAIAGPAAQITGNYRGAERALQQAGVRGAARDQAVVDLNRQRASQIAGLTTGMQPYAAEQLAQMGNQALGQGGAMLGNAGSIYDSLLGRGTANRVYARGEGEKTGKAIGGLVREVGEVGFGRKPPVGKESQPAKPGTKPAAGQPAPSTPQAPQGQAPIPTAADGTEAPANPSVTSSWRAMPPQGGATMMPPQQQGGTLTPPMPFGTPPTATFGTPPKKPANPFGIDFSKAYA